MIGQSVSPKPSGGHIESGHDEKGYTLFDFDTRLVENECSREEGSGYRDEQA